MDNGAGSYRRFLDGDEAAFDDIMNELFRPLTFYICRFVKDVSTAEDIAIDVFSELIASKHKYNFKTSLKTYLFMLGRCRAIDHLRRQKTVVFTPLSEIGELSDEEKSLEEVVLTSERKRIVNEAVARLPEEMREAVYLVYFEDLTYRQAARVLKKNAKQVDNLLYRAKKELRTILGEEGNSLL
jgi:RNA polymerase sigma-70 factor (ECF subfamily)